MKCPICNLDLLIAERQGIEIDYCPKCRGVWLDRGELDKIIEKSASPATQNHGEMRREEPHHYRPEPVHHEGHQRHYGHQRKKKSFFEEIFDFD